MRDKIKYIVFGFIMGISFYAYQEGYFKAGKSDYGAIGTVEWNPLYVYITNE